MQRCCVLGCKSYESTDSANIKYFKFPSKNNVLFEEWLKQISRKNWCPSKSDEICSAHFQTKDIEKLSDISVYLKPTAVPTIFPFKETSSNNKETGINGPQLSNLYFQKNINTERLTQIQSHTTVLPDGINQMKNMNSGVVKLTPVTHNQLKQILPKSNANKIVNPRSKMTPLKPDLNKDVTKMDSNSRRTTKIPILKITINKKYNGPCAQSSEQNNHKRLWDVRNNVDIVDKIPANGIDTEIKPKLINLVPNIVSSPKQVMSNLVPVASEKPIKRKTTVMDVKNDIYLVKTAYTRKGDLSRDNSRNQTKAERLRYLYTKAQRDCDILRIRLKALRERHKHEKDEVKKLQMRLSDGCKVIKKETLNQVTSVYSKRRKTSLVFEETEEEDEYNKLLREIRKIKQDLLNQKYPVLNFDKRSEEGNNVLHQDKKKTQRSQRLTMNNSVSLMTTVRSERVISAIYNKSNESVDCSEQSKIDIESIKKELMSEEEYSNVVFVNV